MPHFSATARTASGKSDLVHLHQEFENVAAGAAAEAVVDLLDGMDGEGRRFFGMKWAEADEILAALLQAHVFANHADDVRLLFDAIGEGACFSHGLAFGGESV